MRKSTNSLSSLLKTLTELARQQGNSDAEWSRRAGMPKETLCRLRSRSTCDFATLQSLGSAVGAQLVVQHDAALPGAREQWPLVDRKLEAALVEAALAGSTRAADWRRLGPSFFVAGLAVMLASVQGFDRKQYLQLAEELHPGATVPRVFQLWLDETPLPPSRFLPMVMARMPDTQPLPAARRNPKK